MIERAVLFVVTDCEITSGDCDNSPIVTESSEENCFAAVVSWIEDSDRVVVAEENPYTNTILAVCHENYSPIKSTSDYYQPLSDVLEYLVAFNLYEDDQSISGAIYSGYQHQLIVQRHFNGDEGEKGMDCIADIQREIETEFEWDWELFATVYPLARTV